MSLPSGARFANGEFERVAKAVEELTKDTSAPRELSVRIVLHIHHEYPKMLYKGTGTKHSVTVADADAEKAARDDGFAEHVPELAEVD